MPALHASPFIHAAPSCLDLDMPSAELVGLVHNPRIVEAGELVHRVVGELGLEGRCWVAPATRIEIGEETLARTYTIVTAGGDGTILRAVRVAAPASVPILGINLGRVGFMTELSVEEAVEKIPSYLGGPPRIEERMMLQASVDGQPDREPRFLAHALNDVVVTRGSLPRMIDIEVTVDGVPLTTYRADGVIVATATGSTGYALSAGGPILHPDARVLLLQSLAAHMNLQTGLVLPGESTVELRAVSASGAVLSIDGLLDTSLTPEDRVVIQRSPHVGRFLRGSPPSAFYADLAHRLGLKERPTPMGVTV